MNEILNALDQLQNLSTLMEDELNESNLKVNSLENQIQIHSSLTSYPPQVFDNDDLLVNSIDKLADKFKNLNNIQEMKNEIEDLKNRLEKQDAIIRQDELNKEVKEKEIRDLKDEIQLKSLSEKKLRNEYDNIKKEMQAKVLSFSEGRKVDGGMLTPLSLNQSLQQSQNILKSEVEFYKKKVLDLEQEMILLRGRLEEARRPVSTSSSQSQNKKRKTMK